MKAALRKRKNQIALIIVFCALTVLAAALFILFSHLGGILRSQQAAETFRGENEELFAQVSAFFPVDKGISEDNVYAFRQTLESKFTDISLEKSQNGSLYADAYSAKGQVTVTGEKGTATVSAIGIGGDFFLFHPLYLRSGNYISGSDLMHDMVILDEELAWRLFGGIDLAGMTVTIGDEPYVVAGVISREDDFASNKAYTDGAGLFMAYDKLNGISSTPISTYELVCADPIEGFALSAVEETFADAVTVENSSRFSPVGIFKVIGSFGQRSMNTAGVVFPYWENAARLIEDILSVVLILAVLFSVFPAVTVIVLAVALIKLGVRKLKVKVPEIAERYSERRYERIMAKRSAGKDR